MRRREAIPQLRLRLSPTISPTTLTVAPASGTYGGTVNLSATLTSSGSAVSGKTINFTLNGNPVGECDHQQQRRGNQG